LKKQNNKLQLKVNMIKQLIYKKNKLIMFLNLDLILALI
jgi:hypothetical protein